VVEQLSKRFGTHVAAFEVDYGELFGFLGPNQTGTTTAVRKISQCASRANCGRNCGTWSQLPQSSSVSDRSRRSLAIRVCRQGVRFCVKCWRSTLMSAKTEFRNEEVEHRGFEPRTPCLPGKIRCAIACRGLPFELGRGRFVPLIPAPCRRNCGINCGTLSRSRS